jgi:ribosomal protein S18 acetylase RimI-like enzyme
MILIKPLEQKDYEQWLPLWNGNNQGRSDPAVTTQTWGRLMDPDYPVHGLGAHYQGTVAGLLHYILHPVTGHIQPVCYMQDVYVDPSCRRKGIARALVRELEKTAKSEKWARIYWLAEIDNQAAQNLYKNIGFKLGFSLHVLPL